MMKNQVFLSSRGEKIRRTFLSHLCNSLKKKGITSFTASESPRESSLQAIQDSLVAIPVISKNHASLNLWVDELADIIECEKKGTLTAVPIFFQLGSSDILNMLRNAGKNVDTMPEIQRKDVEKWLEDHVTKQSGFNSLDCTDDAELVAKVTSFVSNILAPSSSRNQTRAKGLKLTDLIPAKSLKLTEDMSMLHLTRPKGLKLGEDMSRLDVTRAKGLKQGEDKSRFDLTPAKGLKGLKLAKEPFRLYQLAKKGKPFISDYKDNTDISRSSCTEELRSLMLNAKSTVIGVCGVEGVGKTSLVRKLYGKMSPQFQHHVFIKSSIRSQDNSYTDLACEALKESCFHGKSDDFIKEMIQRRKVLLVADDVDNIQQLKGIIKDADWFGRGSRVIVITQDRSLLTQSGVKDIYKLECPTHQEAFSIFSKFAFKGRYNPSDFEALSFRAVQVSNRVPLALKILGSLLCDKEEHEWESIISELEEEYNYSTKLSRYVGRYEYVPTRKIQVDNHIGVDETNRFPLYPFALKSVS